MYDVYKNFAGKGYKWLGKVQTMEKAKILIAQYSSLLPLRKIGDNIYFDASNETLYKVK